MQDVMLILDHDSALTGLIARTLRGQQIYCKPLPFGTSAEDALKLSPRGIIIAADHEAELSLEDFDSALLTAGVPVLALGSMVSALCVRNGGEVLERDAARENVTLGLDEPSLFADMSGGERVMHNLRVLRLPEGLECIATATARPIGFRSAELPLYAVQYPIERNDPDAVQLLHNFASLICKARPTWTEDEIIRMSVDGVREQAGEGRVLCAVSGGVDSAVAAKLAHMAVGDRLRCIFVDTGLFRRDEPRDVIECFASLGIDVALIDAREMFLHALSGVNTAQDKERIASALLHQVLMKQIAEDASLHALVLGTNFNDALSAEPTAAPAADSPLAILEPVRDLFKDEVRRLASTLELPSTIVYRQPFPSSGLALRVYGEVTRERLDILRAADAFFTEEIRQSGQDRRLWQYFATLSRNPDDPSAYAVVLRATQPAAGSAFAARLPYDLLERVQQHILAEIPSVARVVYDLTPSTHYAALE